MKRGFLKRFRANRLVVIFVAVMVYIALAIFDGQLTYSCQEALRNSVIPVWIAFGFSLSVALIFLAVGSFTWFYSRNRQVSFLLFIFSCAIMVAFELETSSSLVAPDTKLASTIASTASSFAIILFAVILLVFPKNHLTTSSTTSSKLWLQEIWSSIRSSPIRWYIFLLIFSLCFGLIDNVAPYFVSSQSVSSWLQVTGLVFVILGLTGSIVTIIISFRVSTVREREQLRFFVSGVILALTPLLLLTAIPQAISNVAPSVNPEITTLTVIFLPLSLGYSILRYQILVFDSYIRRTANWIIGSIFLAVLAYAVYLIYSLFSVVTLPSLVIVVTVIIASIILAPTIWWFAKILTEQVLFKESLSTRRLIDQPIKVDSEVLDLENIGQLITEAALQTFKTTQVGLFVLVEDTGCYHIFPRLPDAQTDDPRCLLAAQLTSSLSTEVPRTTIDILALQESMEKRLSNSRRPLLLHEVIRAEEDMPIGLSRYLTSSSPDEQNDPLFVPVRSQGKMIALLVLGERADQQSYAGPDFEIAQLLLARYSSLLNTARLQERSRHHAALLNDLYKTGTITLGESPDLEGVASAFAKIAADATGAGAEICFYNENENLLQPTIYFGDEKPLLSSNIARLKPGDWSSYYYTGQTTNSPHGSFTDTPPCLDQKPNFPFAWLPLRKGEKHLGILILTYSRTHLFFEEEIRVLEMFVEQFVTNLENTRITIELRAAYERQRELDVLKDQFIMTASHELRTPLTAVLGYIELLGEYNEVLETEMRSDFIAKAHRGCDELTLMVNNIMDANRVQADVDNTKITSVSLEESVIHIVEIIESLIKREKREISVTLPPALFVMADSMRLRQVLLNLVSNALKYSPPGTRIEISTEAGTDYATISVRDYGSGVPLEEQNRLFERFVRLERDMNSPIRGAGLGLYICRQLIEAMGGTIWVQSTGKAGEGSTFFFTLRLAPPQLEAREPHNLSALA